MSKLMEEFVCFTLAGFLVVLGFICASRFQPNLEKKNFLAGYSAAFIGIVFVIVAALVLSHAL